MTNKIINPITDIAFIKRVIPQKDPFVMVDSLYYYDDAKAVSGLYVSPKNILSAGKYFSEAGMIENMAQSVALHGGYGAYINREGEAQKGFLGAIKKLEIKRLPEVGTSIRTTIVIDHDIMGVKLSQIVVEDEQGECLAIATMKTVTVKN